MKYQIIYADPPWQYRNNRTGGSMHPQDYHYPKMTTKEIMDLPVSDITEKNCALFLWATVPMIQDAFKVMEAWGFKYKTMLFWRKTMSWGMGFWYRGQVEVLLLGIKGKLKAFRVQRANIIQARVREHSRKPDEFYELIELTGLSPCIELFARNKRDGWDCWGNEVESDIELMSDVGSPDAPPPSETLKP